MGEAKRRYLRAEQAALVFGPFNPKDPRDARADKHRQSFLEQAYQAGVKRGPDGFTDLVAGTMVGIAQSLICVSESKCPDALHDRLLEFVGYAVAQATGAVSFDAALRGGSTGEAEHG